MMKIMNRRVYKTVTFKTIFEKYLSVVFPLFLFFTGFQNVSPCVFSERSGSCLNSEVDNCNHSPESFTSPWVVFRDSDQGFLNVSSMPLDAAACGSASPMWIKGMSCLFRLTLNQSH